MQGATISNTSLAAAKNASGEGTGNNQLLTNGDKFLGGGAKEIDVPENAQLHEEYSKKYNAVANEILAQLNGLNQTEIDHVIYLIKTSLPPTRIWLSS